MSVVLAGAAHADSFGFEVVENNSGIGATIAAGMSLEVTDTTGGVTFTLDHHSSDGGFVAEIYWDTNSGALGVVLLDELTSRPAEWSLNGAAPPNLPGGSTLSPTFTADFSSDVGNTKSARIDNGETGAWEFSLLSGESFDSVIDALNDGSLRVGFHMGGIGTADKSDSFVTTTPVPEPGSLLLMGLGLAGVGAVRRRRNAVQK